MRVRLTIQINKDGSITVTLEPIYWGGIYVLTLGVALILLRDKIPFVCGKQIMYIYKIHVKYFFYSMLTVFYLFLPLSFTLARFFLTFSLFVTGGFSIIRFKTASRFLSLLESSPMF